MLRVLLAAGLAALLSASAAHVHLHDGWQADAAPEDAPCALCQLRSAEPAAAATLDAAPRVVWASEVVLAPGLPPVSGAPLGAIPGQSPPALA
jgi:hypothetical protein